jgi:membrane associated rhomboid family serine protease
METDVRYAVWVIALGVVGGILHVMARIGGVGFAAGVAGLIGGLVLVTRLTRKPSQKVGQPDREHRVIDLDRDRWGGADF